MPELTNHEMIEKAKSVLQPRKIFLGEAASVACAMLSASGNLYLGVCIDVGSGIGFCAEHAAIAAMITAGETAISKVVALGEDGTILPPCGRCREFMYQIDQANLECTQVVLDEGRVVRLKDLLPHPWHESWNAS